MLKNNMLNAVPVENFRNADGNFPTDLKCSNCNCNCEVVIELIRGGPILRLCKGCLTKYIEMIDETYVKEMSKKPKRDFIDTIYYDINPDMLKVFIEKEKELNKLLSKYVGLQNNENIRKDIINDINEFYKTINVLYV